MWKWLAGSRDRTCTVQIHCKQLHSHTSYVCKLATACNILHSAIGIQIWFVIYGSHNSFLELFILNLHSDIFTYVWCYEFIFFSPIKFCHLSDLYQSGAMNLSVPNYTWSIHSREVPSNSVKILSLTMLRSNTILSSAMIRNSSECRHSQADPTLCLSHWVSSLEWS